MEKKKLTLVELWAEGTDHHHGLTPGRAQEIADIISEVSKARGESRPPRLEWLRRRADDTTPET